MQYLLYFCVALLATTAGAMTGMGGGVIMKPLLDVLGQYDVGSINMLSSITVLCMSLVSVARYVRAKTKIEYKTAIPLAIGSVAGGVVGGRLLSAIIAATGNANRVTVLQNAILAGLIIVVFVYMRRKDKIPTLGLTGIVPSLLVGVGLGLVSSFLGIGGGPINVAVIMLVFSLSIKEAAVSSLIVILFAQTASFATTAATTGFGGYSLTMLPAMVVGAIAGGLLGARLNTRQPAKRVELMFNLVQVVVFIICVTNVVRSL